MKHVFSRSSALMPLIGLAGLAMFAALFVLNGWLSDDAYTGLKVVDNVVHGRGLVYNVAERVQAFTNPLWILCLALGHFVVDEVYYLTYGLAFLCSALTIVVVWRALVLRPGGHWRFGAMILLLCTSKAWIDYSSSGLENPLSYLLAALLYARMLPRPEEDDTGSEPEPMRELGITALLTALMYVNRPDLVLLAGPPLVDRFLRATLPFSPGRFARAAGRALLGLTPAMAWAVFSVVYYGFLFPNTYYAKLDLGFPASLILGQGAWYYWNSLTHDPVTLCVIASGAASGIAWGRKGWGNRSTRFGALGILLYLAYVWKIGGCFMSGRHFSVPFLLAALFLTGLAPVRRAALLATLAMAASLATAALSPWAPINFRLGSPNWNYEKTHGVADEKAAYHPNTSLLRIPEQGPPVTHPLVPYARSLHPSSNPVASHVVIGYFGFYLDPSIYLLDPLALPDPLLSRMPIRPEARKYFRISHHLRIIPDGYVESVATGRNLIKDPRIHAYYEMLRVITRGPLFTRERWQYIYRLNGTRDRKLHLE